MIKKLLKGNKANMGFIAINVITALLGFVRSYITMKFLGFEEVGLIAMVLSVMEFVSLFQMGLLNGGFRLYFVSSTRQKKNLNNLLFSYFGFLGVAIILALLVYSSLVSSDGNGLYFLVVGAIAGVLGLGKNWITNIMIAERTIDKLNRYNVWSNLLSFLFIILVPFYGLAGSLLLVVSQPLFFMAMALYQNRHLLPDGFFYHKNVLRKILALGFVPFLAGILAKLNDQIERWGIIKILGLEELGKYNLAIIYSSVFLLIPTTISSLFFTNAMNMYKQSNITGMNAILNKYMYIIFAYIIAAIGLTYLLLPPLVTIFLNKYEIGIKYIWYIMPFLVAQVVMLPITMKYQIYARFRVMFVAYGLSVLLFLLTVIFYVNMERVPLEYFAAAKSANGLVILIISFIGFHLFTKKDIARANKKKQ